MVESQIRFPLVANETACKIKACQEVCQYCDGKDIFILPVYCIQLICEERYYFCIKSLESPEVGGDNR